MSPLMIDILIYLGVVLVVTLLLLGLIWLVDRLNAERCPRCGSSWTMKFEGEWAGSGEWVCYACWHYWR